MIPVPFPTAVMRPVLVTVATLDIAEDHEIVLLAALDGVTVATA